MAKNDQTNNEDWGSDIVGDPAQTLDVGDELDAIYIGSCFVMGQHGETQHHVFVDGEDDEKRITIWGALLLDEGMAKAKLGHRTRVVHTDQKRGRAHVYSIRQMKRPADIDSSLFIGHAVGGN